MKPLSKSKGNSMNFKDRNRVDGVSFNDRCRAFSFLLYFLRFQSQKDNTVARIGPEILHHLTYSFGLPTRIKLEFNTSINERRVQ